MTSSYTTETIEEMLSRITPEPWLFVSSLVYALNDEGTNRFTASVDSGWVVQNEQRTGREEIHADTEFIAAAPSIVRQLLAERDTARIENERLQSELIQVRLELAELRVRPIVEAEKKSEDLGDIMNLRFTSGK